jgi:hypothetical protein
MAFANVLVWCVWRVHTRPAQQQQQHKKDLYMQPQINIACTTDCKIEKRLIFHETTIK